MRAPVSSGLTSAADTPLDWASGDGGAHCVQFYESDAFLMDEVCRFLVAGFDAGQAGVVIATPSHRDALARRIRGAGIDLDAALTRGSFVALDASDTLARFMVGDQPDANRFHDVVGGVMARAAAQGGHPRVRAFGEMVALLTAAGNADGALQLEQLWNELTRRRSFALLCAYPIRGVQPGDDFAAVCAEHTHAIPAESYTALTDEEERLRAVVQLQVEGAAREAMLAERVAELAELERRRNEFLAMLGHELRNPLAAVRNAIVTARLDDARRTQALDIARRQTEQLGHLVDDLLDVARITQGRVALRKEPVYVGRIVETAIETTRAHFDDRGHRLVVSLPSDCLQVEADPARLQQVLGNLLNNAAKYTEPGGHIEVVAERDGSDAVLRVTDSGIGIAPEMLPHVFDLFAQAARSIDRAQGGLGVGLTLVKRLIQLHGGRVEARSAGLGAGSVFEIRLPAMPEEVPVQRASEELVPATGGAHVLIVEDNVDAAESLKMLLETLGHRVVAVGDGDAALGALDICRFDVALVDLGLPVMDGYEIARRIRALPHGRAMLLAALTGYGQDQDRERTAAAGFDRHLTKPLDLKQLDVILAAARADAGRSRRARVVPHPASRPAARIRSDR